MIEQMIDRRMVEGQRQRAVLITIDYEGYGFIEDGDLFRGRAVAVHAPNNFGFGDRRSEIAQIDRTISNQMVIHGADPERLKESEFNYMESELLRASRKLAANGPELMLIPVGEYTAMGRKLEDLHTRLQQEQAFNRSLATRNMIVRNQATRWKALATKLRLQRNEAQRGILRRLFDRLRR